MELPKDCEMLDQNTDPQFFMEQVNFEQFFLSDVWKYFQNKRRQAEVRQARKFQNYATLKLLPTYQVTDRCKV